MLKCFGIDGGDIGFDFEGGSGVVNGLDNRKVNIFMMAMAVLEIFSDESEVNSVVRIFEMVDKKFPLGKESGWFAAGKIKLPENFLGKFLLVED